MLRVVNEAPIARRERAARRWPVKNGQSRRERERERERETDRRTDGRTDRRTDRQTDRQTDIFVHMHTAWMVKTLP